MLTLACAECKVGVSFRISVYPEIGKFGRDQGTRKFYRRHIVDIPRIIFLHNTDIGKIGHFWMNTN
ncbi:hypothetical protein DESC_830095 [Desulfosarcina cetonica]|nr:hypothetical protein DESC_830095 [Desulfosarcina cetonica]